MVWAASGGLSLDAALREAIAHNPELAQARLDLETAGWGVGAARAVHDPSLSLGVDLGQSVGTGRRLHSLGAVDLAVDNNCDEVVDEGFDSDGDGENSAADCEDGTDCDDTDASIGAEAEETPYDDIDQDCDGEDLVDVDGDGFTGEDGGGNDCDDDDDSVYPGADEIAKDGIDQDCDGSVSSAPDVSSST